MKKFFDKKLNTFASGTFSMLIKCSVFLFGLLLMIFASNISKVEAASITLCDGNDKTNSTYTTSMEVWICETSGLASPVVYGYHVTYDIDGGYIVSNNSYTASVFSDFQDPAGIRGLLGSATTAANMGMTSYTTKQYAYGTVSFSGQDITTSGTGSTTIAQLEANKIENIALKESLTNAARMVGGDIVIGMINVCIYNGDPYATGTGRYTQMLCDQISWGTLAQINARPKLTICDGNDKTNSDYTTSMSVWICDITMLESPVSGGSGGYHVTYDIDGGFILSDEAYDSSIFDYIYDPANIKNSLSSASEVTSLGMGLEAYSPFEYAYGIVYYSGQDVTTSGTGSTTIAQLKANQIENIALKDSLTNAASEVDGAVFISTINVCVYNGDPYATGTGRYTQMLCDQINWGTLAQIYDTVPAFGVTYLMDPDIDDESSRWNYTNNRSSTVIIETGFCNYIELRLNSSTASSFNTIYCAFDGSTVPHNSNVTSITLPSSVTEGVNTIYVKAYNHHGDYNTTSFTFTYDTVEPEVSEFYLTDEDGIPLEYTTSYFNYFGMSLYTGDTKLWSVYIETEEGDCLYNEYNPADNSSNAVEFIILGEINLTDDYPEQILLIYIEDWAGNTYASSFTIQFGVPIPEILGIMVEGNDSADNPRFTNTRTVTISFGLVRAMAYSFTIKDSTSQIYSYQNPGNNMFSEMSVSANLLNAQGTHTLTLTVTTASGSDSTTATIILDTIAPTITRYNLIDEEYIGTVVTESSSKVLYSNQTALITDIVATDSNNDAYNTLYYKISNTEEYEDGVYTTQPYSDLTLLSTSEGRKTLVLSVKDSAGNIATSTFYVEYDITAPIISDGTFVIGCDSYGNYCGYINRSTLLADGSSVLPFKFMLDEGDYYQFTFIATNAAGYREVFTSSMSYMDDIQYELLIEHPLDSYYEATVTVTDRAGNTDTAYTDGARDTSSPLIQITERTVEQGYYAGTQMSANLTDYDYYNDEEISMRLLTITSSYELHASLLVTRAVDLEFNHNVPYSIADNYYYLYAFIEVVHAYDWAGNPLVDYDYLIEFNGDEYYVKEFVIDIIGDDTQEGILNEDYVPEDSNTDNDYTYQLIGESTKFLLIGVNTCVSGCTLNALLQDYGFTLIDDVIVSDSNYLPKKLIRHGQSMELVDILVINTAPRVGSTNTGASITINKGEEVSNIGLSFRSSDGEKLEVDTLITLNGVKVKEVDTNVPGVYSVRQMATDKYGKKAVVTKTITVLDAEVKEEIIEEEEVMVVEEILVPVVHNAKNVETASNTQVTGNTVEVIEPVEMHIEKKENIKGYQKRKEIRRTKKEKFSFKLFSKYFFKIYDG